MIAILIAVLSIIWCVHSLSSLGTSYTIGLWGIIKMIMGSYTDIIKITAYVSLIIIAIFFIIYSLFPPTVLNNPKNWTPLRIFNLSLSSYITLGRGDIHVKNPILQTIMAIEGLFGFMFMIFIGARMVLIGKPILSPQKIAARENLNQDDRVLFNEIDVDHNNKISFSEFYKEMERSRARQGIKYGTKEQAKSHDWNLFDKMDLEKDEAVKYPEFHKELEKERNKEIDLRDIAAGHLSAARGASHAVPTQFAVKSHTTHHSNK